MALGNKRWKASLLVVFIFILGFLTGALTANLMSTASEEPTSAWHQHRDSEQLMERLSERLHLTPEQSDEIRQILVETKQEYSRLRRETRPQFRDIRARSRERMRAVLNPEQRDLFEAFIRQHDEQVGRHRHKN